MITYLRLKQHPAVFLKMTGLRPNEFDHLLLDLLPRFGEAEAHRLARTKRQRGRVAATSRTCPPLTKSC